LSERSADPVFNDKEDGCLSLLFPPAGAEHGAGGKNAYSKWPVATTDLGLVPALTVEDVMAVKAPSAPMVHPDVTTLMG